MIPKPHRPYRIKATIKQKRAYKLLVGKVGSVTEAMKQADYSLNTANTPQKLTDSRGFQELIKHTLSDEKLNKVLNEGLDAKKHVIATLYQNEREDIPDYATRHKYVETGLKLRGYLKEAPPTFNTVILTVEQKKRIA